MLLASRSLKMYVSPKNKNKASLYILNWRFRFTLSGCYELRRNTWRVQMFLQRNSFIKLSLLSGIRRQGCMRVKRHCILSGLFTRYIQLYAVFQSFRFFVNSAKNLRQVCGSNRHNNLIFKIISLKTFSVINYSVAQKMCLSLWGHSRLSSHTLTKLFAACCHKLAICVAVITTWLRREAHETSCFCLYSGRES